MGLVALFGLDEDGVHEHAGSHPAAGGTLGAADFAPVGVTVEFKAMFWALNGAVL